MIPVLIVMIAISAVTNCMHLALHLATERIWVVVAAQGDSNSSRFLIRCNRCVLCCAISLSNGEADITYIFNGDRATYKPILEKRPPK